MTKQKRHGGRKPLNVLFRRSVSVTQEMVDKGLSDAKRIREAALESLELAAEVERLTVENQRIRNELGKESRR